MTIRIIDEPEITMTRAEYERLHREWCASNGMTVAPTSFEAFVAGRLLPIDQKIATAREEMKSWSPERLASMRLQGPSAHRTTPRGQP